MTDSLKTRVGRVIAGSVHALIDHLENSPQQAAQLQELDELLRQYKIAERLAQLRAGKA